MKVGKLYFKSLGIEGRQSIASDLSDEEARGIYAYEFTDGTWYVGKSVDVRKRHVAHMHEYRHEDPPLVPKNMLWAVVCGDDRELDYAETEAIAWFERKGYSLRNVMKTGRPRGNTEVVVDTGEGWGVSIPWEREDMPKSSHPFVFEPSDAMKDKFEQLRQRDEFPQLMRIVRRYVGETVPAPADSAGSLWVATALPSTSGGDRLCCISCSGMETLVMKKGERFGLDESWGFVNVKATSDGKLSKWHKREKVGYRSLPNSTTLRFDTLDELERLLNDEVMLDCCYRANAELMRRGPAAFRMYNNPYFIEAILSDEVFEGEKSVRIAKRASVDLHRKFSQKKRLTGNREGRSSERLPNKTLDETNNSIRPDSSNPLTSNDTFFNVAKRGLSSLFKKIFK